MDFIFILMLFLEYKNNNSCTIYIHISHRYTSILINNSVKFNGYLNYLVYKINCNFYELINIKKQLFLFYPKIRLICIFLLLL
jgi:hypothetical protein